MHIVVATLDQDVRHAGKDQLARRVLIEGHDEIDGRERGQDCHSIVERIQRSVRAFSEISHRLIGVDGNDERSAESAGLFEIRDVPAMQHVEHAIREHTRPR